MACSDQISTEDLLNAKLDATTLGEVATSRAGAESGGAPITKSTNRFNETTDTIQGRLNKLGVIVDDPIKNWSASLLVSDLRAHRYPATTGDVYVPVKPLPFTTGLTFNSADWVLWSGYADTQIELVTNDFLINDLSQAYDFETRTDMVNSTIAFPNGKHYKTKGFTTVGDGGGAEYLQTAGASPTFGSPAMISGHASYHPGETINALAIGVIDGVGSNAQIQSTQDLSELHKKAVDFSGLSDIRFTGGITYSTWLHWKGAGKYDTIFTPTDKTRTLVGDTHWVSQSDKSVDITFLMMEDFGVDGEWAGFFPSVELAVGWVGIIAEGANHQNVHYLRLRLVDVSWDVCLHQVSKYAGGTINNVSMMFCDYDTTHPSEPNRNANVFKSIHGTIDDPGVYGEYPITNLTSFGNTCRGARSLCDFKRGTRHFSHNRSAVIDNSDVASISVDGGKDGVIGPDNTGYQTDAFADAKNFYEIQGEDIEIMGGNWDANNRALVAGGCMITDYIYPAEYVDGVYDANPSVNVNLHGITIKNIATAQNAVRYINSKTCSVNGVKAFGIGAAAVTFEYPDPSGEWKDINGERIIPQGNSVDNIEERDCAFALVVEAGNFVKIGENIGDAFGQMNVSVPNTGTVEPSMVPMYSTEQMCKNGEFEIYSKAATQPLGWESGSATRNYQTSDKPYGPLGALELDDTDPGAVQSCSYLGSIVAKEGDIFYFTTWVKLDTSTRSSILIQEFNDGAFLGSTYIELNPTTSWEKRARKHKVVNPATTRILVNLNPAANSVSDNSFTGKALFADFRIGRKFNWY